MKNQQKWSQSNFGVRRKREPQLDVIKFRKQKRKLLPNHFLKVRVINRFIVFTNRFILFIAEEMINGS